MVGISQVRQQILKSAELMGAAALDADIARWQAQTSAKGS